MDIIKLGANQPADRFYRGGAKIRAFRDNQDFCHEEDDQLRVPEDWVASTTPLFGEKTLGLTRLPSGELLRDAVDKNPKAWLGSNHVESRGSDVFLLVKLLDAGERLPVHAHPDQQFSGKHLGLAHGKTESWIALCDSEVALAFKRDISKDELAIWVNRQETSKFLDAMHVLKLAAGDSVWVPAGLPHAIGKGAFVVELQEPSDLSILMEWAGFAVDGETDGHLKLGFDLALDAVDRRGWSADEVEKLRTATASTRGGLFPDAQEFFRADRLGEEASWEPSFAVVVAVAGSGRLVPSDGESVEVRAGETLVVPHAVGSVVVEGKLEVIVCRPPK